MKNNLFIIILICTILFGIIGSVAFFYYGGNNCDQPPSIECDCFCCNMFNSRGYEACSQFGLYSGVVLGVIVGILIYRIKFKE